MSEAESSNEPPEARDTDQSAETEQLEDTEPQHANVSDIQEPFQEAGSQSGDRTITFDFPEPEPVWNFNTFLSDIASGLSNDELEKIKCLFVEIIGKRALEQIKIPEELFRLLRERKFISQDNLMWLQECLYALQRKDLIEKAVEYATKVGDCMYFYPKDTQGQVNGFRQVTYHVTGKDFKNFTRTCLEDIRRKTSKLLSIPIKYVLIVGVDPSSSMLITFLIPDMYADILESMIERKEKFDDLYRSGIDVIIIGEHNHHIQGLEDVKAAESSQQAKLINVYQQLKEKTEQLDDAEATVIKQSRTIRELESKDLKSAVVVKTAESLFHNVVPKDAVSSPSSLETQCAFTLFVESLKRPEMLQMDRSLKQLIQNMLDANTQVVASRMRDSYAFEMKQLSLAIQELQKKTIPLEMEVMKHKFFCTSNLDQRILESYQRILGAFDESTIRKSVSLHPIYKAIMMKISQELTSNDKHKLFKLLGLETDDEIKRLIDNDEKLILECILHREIQKQNSLVDLSFISTCLRKIGRADLEKKFMHLLHNPEQPKSKEQPTGASPRPKFEESGQHQFDQIAADVKHILIRVDRIDKTIQMTKDVGIQQKNLYNSSFGASLFFPGYLPKEGFSSDL